MDSEIRIYFLKKKKIYIYIYIIWKDDFFFFIYIDTGNHSPKRKCTGNKAAKFFQVSDMVYSDIKYWALSFFFLILEKQNFAGSEAEVTMKKRRKLMGFTLTAFCIS